MSHSALVPGTSKTQLLQPLPLVLGLQGFPSWRNLVHLSSRSLGQAPSQSRHLHILVSWCGVSEPGMGDGGGRMLPIELAPPLKGFSRVKPPRVCLCPPSGHTSLQLQCWVPATLSPCGTSSSWETEAWHHHPPPCDPSSLCLSPAVPETHWAALLGGSWARGQP